MAHFRRRVLLGYILVLVAITTAHADPHFEVVYNANGKGNSLGVTVAGKDGTLYGTGSAIESGEYAAAVASLTPPQPGRTEWTRRALYTAALPLSINSGIALDASGAIYGSTISFVDRAGTVFRLSPPNGPGRPWVKTILHTFPFVPIGEVYNSATVGGLTTDSKGRLYGALIDGGSGQGSIFMLTPPGTRAGKWGYSVLHDFQADEGFGPLGPFLLRGTSAAPELFGVAQSGGKYDCGTVFKLKFLEEKRTWGLSVIHTFTCGLAGGYPTGTLISDRDLTIYGATTFGGISDNGAIFKLVPPLPGKTSWTESALYDFDGATGSEPVGVTEDSGGRLYGATIAGGRRCVTLGCGLLFRLTPRDYGGHSTPWNRITLHNFGEHDGFAQGPLVKVQNADGTHSLFGATLGDPSSNSRGMVFKITVESP